MISEIMEAFMIGSLGLSWLINVIKSFKSKTAQNKSIVFIGLILFAYGCGILCKIFQGELTYVFAFYILNFVLVGLDIILIFRNRRFDKMKDDE